MTPKQKAEELIDKFIFAQFEAGDIIKNPPLAKQCALICVDEIISELKSIQFDYDLEMDDRNIRYFNEVKQEIENL